MKRVVLVRVDDRLIHGQIIEAWVPYTGANSLLVINDAASRDMIKRDIMECSVPDTILLNIKDIKGGVDYLKDALVNINRLTLHHHRIISMLWIKMLYSRFRDVDEKIIVLFENLKDAIRAYRMGFHFRELNLGNIHDFVRGFEEDGEGKGLIVGSSIFLNDEDIKIIARLKQEDIVLDVRCVPGERTVAKGLCQL